MGDDSSCSRCVGLFIRVSSLVAALMMLVVGGAHLQSSFTEWCPSAYADCFGPWLYWHPSDFFASDNSNLGNTYFGPNYGKVFSLEPTMLCARWGPLFIAIIGFLEHVAPAATGLPYKTPAGMMLFHVFVALFVAFPCAGNFGILTGFVCLFVAALCIVGCFVDLRHEPLTFGHNSDSFIYKVLLVFSSVTCGTILVPLMKITSLITASLVTIIGLVHIGNQMTAWCSNANPEDYSCVGPWLFYDDQDYFKESKNCYSSLDHCQNDPQLYGSVFTIEPKVMCCLWLPLLFGALALSEHVKPFSYRLVSGTGRTFFFHIFLMLFVCFPCAGNFGILVGCWCAVPILVAALMLIFCPTQTLEVNFASTDYWIPDSWKHKEDVRYHVLEAHHDQETGPGPSQKRTKQSRHTKVVTVHGTPQL